MVWITQVGRSQLQSPHTNKRQSLSQRKTPIQRSKKVFHYAYFQILEGVEKITDVYCFHENQSTYRDLWGKLYLLTSLVLLTEYKKVFILSFLFPCFQDPINWPFCNFLKRGTKSKELFHLFGIQSYTFSSFTMLLVQLQLKNFFIVNSILHNTS